MVASLIIRKNPIQNLEKSNIEYSVFIPSLAAYLCYSVNEPISITWPSGSATWQAAVPGFDKETAEHP